MNARNNVISGITEVGSSPGGVDTSWGETEQNGVTLQIDGNDVDVMSGQSKILEDSIAVSRNITLTIRLMKADLVNVRDSLGLPASAMTGDLQGATPTAEVLEIDEALIGSMEQSLYVEAPGPAGPRRVAIPRAKNRGGLTINFASNDYVKLESTWTVLKPQDGTKPVTITDAL